MVRGPIADAVTRGIVLVAEDDDELRMVLALTFAALGYEVGTAATGAEMLVLLESVETPAAILVDLVMPGVLGSSVLDYLTHEPRFATVPTAIVTGLPDLAPAGFPVFSKPAPLEQLLWFVQSGGRWVPDAVSPIN